MGNWEILTKWYRFPTFHLYIFCSSSLHPPYVLQIVYKWTTKSWFSKYEDTRTQNTLPTDDSKCIRMLPNHLGTLYDSLWNFRFGIPLSFIGKFLMVRTLTGAYWGMHLGYWCTVFKKRNPCFRVSEFLSFVFPLSLSSMSENISLVFLYKRIVIVQCHVTISHP